MSIIPPGLHLLSRSWRWLSALAGASLIATSPAAAQSVAPSAAPAAWVAYAEAATATITTWLEADSEPALRVRAYLDRTRAAPDQPTPPLVLKVWVASDGTVSRIDFPAFAQEDANADLRGLIVGRRLSGAPPRDMLLPVRIAIQLDPAPAPAASNAPGAGTPPARTI